jgi:hypothetical protein
VRLPVVVAIAIAIAGCKHRDEPEGSGSGSGSGSGTAAGSANPPDKLEGTLTVDGAPATLTACRPGHAVHTFVEVATSKGKLRFEDRRLYWHRDPDAITRGDELSCDKLDRSWGGGFRADGTAYWRGTLAFSCTGPATVSGNLVLDCGHITAQERSQLDSNRQQLLDKQQGSGSAR